MSVQSTRPVGVLGDERNCFPCVPRQETCSGRKRATRSPGILIPVLAALPNHALIRMNNPSSRNTGGVTAIGGTATPGNPILGPVVATSPRSRRHEKRSAIWNACCHSRDKRSLRLRCFHIVWSSQSTGTFQTLETSLAGVCPPTRSAVFAASAVFETQSDLGSGDLTFILHMNHFNPGHLIGRFRLSVTADDRSTFADGLPNGGDVTANWTVLTSPTISVPGAMTSSILGDDSILTAGTIANTGVYSVSFAGVAAGSTGIRLEAIQDGSLPLSGPEHFPQNRKFCPFRDSAGLYLRSRARDPRTDEPRLRRAWSGAAEVPQSLPVRDAPKFTAGDRLGLAYDETSSVSFDR